MGLSTKSIEILMDLLEMKLAAIEISDRQDAKELARMKKCMSELVALQNNSRPLPPKSAEIIDLHAH